MAKQGLLDWIEKHRHYLYVHYAGFTAKGLAEHLGVTRQTVHRWIKGIGSPSEEQDRKIRELVDANR
jgi:hypothetical protein